eukprot:3048265-Amphidinium_carterae.1
MLHVAYIREAKHVPGLRWEQFRHYYTTKSSAMRELATAVTAQLPTGDADERYDSNKRVTKRRFGKMRAFGEQPQRPQASKGSVELGQVPH